MTPPLNLCTACRRDFTSTRLFDAHRVGKHEYVVSPERPDGRRCLSLEEMTAKGWTQDERGRWYDPERSEDVRRRLADASIR